MKYVLICTLNLVVTRAVYAQGPQALLDIGNPGVIGKYELADCKARIVSEGPRKVLRVAFGHDQDWPHIRFSLDQLNLDADWSAYGALAVTIRNPGEQTVTVTLVLGSEDGKKRYVARARIRPDGKPRIILPLSGAKRIIGMVGQPPFVEMTPLDRVPVADGNSAMNPADVSFFQVSLDRPDDPITLEIHNVELLSPIRHDGPFVDKFGQYNGADWPGKLHDESDFPKRLKKELTDLKAHPVIPGRNKFGGWANGPSRKATGHFSVTRHGDTWWLVDPEGKLFWSSGFGGVNIVESTRTFTRGRETCYEWLPQEDSPLFRFLDQHGAMDFYKANLLRKYGQTYDAAFYDMAVRRLPSWDSTPSATGATKGRGSFERYRLRQSYTPGSATLSPGSSLTRA